MKIGILTHYYGSTNYGGNLQAYALCKVLEELGHEPQQVQIDWIDHYQNLLNPRNRIRTECLKRKVKDMLRPVAGLLLPRYRKKWQAQKATRQRLVNAFSRFNRELIPHSDVRYTPKTIRKALKQYDVFLTGSDQVWNPIWYFPPFFLDFVPSHQPKLSYAASIGHSTLPASVKARFQAHLKDFVGVSVREADAVPLLDGNAQLVLDPTMLLSKDQWLQVAQPPQLDTPYIFCYFLGNDPEIRTAATAYAAAAGLPLVTIPNATGISNSNDRDFGDIRLEDPSPEAFLGLIAKAALVFTDSFHATVFSLLLHRQFITFPRLGHGNSRIETLLQLFDAQDRFCPEPLQMPARLPEISYDVPWEKFDQAAAFSRSWLQTTLQKAKEMLP